MAVWFFFKFPSPSRCLPLSKRCFIGSKRSRRRDFRQFRLCTGFLAVVIRKQRCLFSRQHASFALRFEKSPPACPFPYTFACLSSSLQVLLQAELFQHLQYHTSLFLRSLTATTHSCHLPSTPSDTSCPETTCRCRVMSSQSARFWDLGRP